MKTGVQWQSQSAYVDVPVAASATAAAAQRRRRPRVGGGGGSAAPTATAAAAATSRSNGGSDGTAAAVLLQPDGLLASSWQQDLAGGGAASRSTSARPPPSVSDEIQGATRLAQLEALLAHNALAQGDVAQLLWTAVAIARRSRLRSTAWGAATAGAASSGDDDTQTAQRVAHASIQQLLARGCHAVPPRTLGRVTLSVGTLLGTLLPSSSSSSSSSGARVTAAAAAGRGSPVPPAAATTAAEAAAAMTLTADSRAAPITPAPGGAAHRLHQLLSAAEPHASLLQLLEGCAPQWQAAAAAAAAAMLEDPLSASSVHSGRKAYLHPQDAVDVAYGLSCLGVQPPPAFTTALLSATTPLLWRMQPKQLSMLAYSLACLGVMPDAAWMAAWHAAVLSKVESFAALDVANSLWAAATLQQTSARMRCNAEEGRAETAATIAAASSAAAVQQAAAALLDRAQQLGGDMTAQGLANTAWAAAVLCRTSCVSVEPVWLGGLLRCCTWRGREFNAHEASNVLWSAATLLRQRTAASGSRLSSSSGRSAPAAGSSGLALCGVAAEFRDEVLLPLAPRFGPRDWSQVLWASATLGLGLPDAWQEALWLGSTRQLRSWGPQALANAVWALARAGATPPRGWWAMFEASTLAAAVRFQASELAMVAWALGRLTRLGLTAPTPHWWERFWAVSAARMLPAGGETAAAGAAAGVAPQTAARHAVVALHAASLVGQAPPGAWLQAALDAVLLALSNSNINNQQQQSGPSVSSACHAARALLAVARLQRSAPLTTSSTPIAALVQGLADGAWALPAAAAVPALSALPDLLPVLSPTLQRHAAVQLLARCGAVAAWPVEVLHALSRLSRCRSEEPLLIKQPTFWVDVSRAAKQQRARAAGGAAAAALNTRISHTPVAGVARSAFFQQMESALLQDLPSLSPSDLLLCLNALLKLRHEPSHELSAAVVRAVANAAAASRSSNNCHSLLPLLLLRVAKLGCGRTDCAADMIKLLTRCDMESMSWSGSQLCEAAYGIAHLVQNSGISDSSSRVSGALRAWLRTWLAASCVAMRSGDMTVRGVAGAASALVRLCVDPGDTWLRTAVAATAGRLHDAPSVEHLVQLATCLQRLGASPSIAWQKELAGAVGAVAAAQDAGQPQRASASALQPVQVGLLGLAWHRWGWQPERSVCDSLLAASQPCLEAGTYRSSRMQLTLTLLAAAGWMPPAQWVAAAQQCAEAAAGQGAYSEVQCDKISWALKVIAQG